MKGFRWKIVTGIVGAALVTTGTVGVVLHYRDGAFQPNDYAQERQRKENQIVFPGQDNALGDQPSDNSDLWKQDADSTENMKPEDRPSSSVLFQNVQVADNRQIDSDNQSKDSSSEEQKEKVYAPGGDNTDGPKTPGHTIKDNNSNSDSTNTDNDNSTPAHSDANTSQDTNGDNTTDSNNKPSDSDKPGNTDKPSNADKPGNTEEPTTPDDPVKPDDPSIPDHIDADTTVPSLPKDDDVIAADPYPGDDHMNIKNEEDYKRYSLIIAGIIDDDDIQYSFYEGEYLNDQRVFCATRVYLCVDGNPLYRLTELNDNFKLGEYPSQITEDTISITYYYRPSPEYDWIEETFDAPVFYQSKLLLQDWKSGEYAKQVMVPKDQEQVPLFPYYNRMNGDNSFMELFSGLETTERMNELFLGWSETEGGTSVGPYYTVKETGAKVLYPVPKVTIDSSYTVDWVDADYYSTDGHTYSRKYQTLTNYEGASGTLAIPDGVNVVEMGDIFDFFVSSYERMEIPQSVLKLAGGFFSTFQGFNITKEYVVSEDNTEYSSYDGMLLNKAQTEVYDIPDDMTSITIPDTVQSIQFSDDNASLSEIHFTADKPGKFDFDKLAGVKLYVPAASYLKYLAAWGKNPGIWGNELVADGGDIEDFTEDENGIYSPDGKVLKSAKTDVSGTYIVPEGIETIAEGALDNCGAIELLILPKSLRKLEDNSLSGNPPAKIVFLGEEAPAIAEHTFADSSILQVHDTAKDSYQKAWKDVMGDQADMVHYREFSYVVNGVAGFDYLEEGACEDGICEEGVVLVKAPSGLTVFNKNTLSGLSCKEIAANAFAGCDQITMVDLPASISWIGREAFAGCSKLEGVISQATDYIHIGERAFYNDPELRWIAWNAKTIDNDGYGYYGQQFAVRDSNGSDYNMNCYSPSYVVTSEAGGYLLYGVAVDDGGNATKDFYLVGATTSIAGNVMLKETTMEITPSVFSNCKNSFTISDWSYVQYIDNSAFSNSGVSGEVCLSPYLQLVDMYAFYGCSNITKLVIDGSSLNGYTLGYSCFRGCTGLSSVEFTGTGSYDIGGSAFSDCSNLSLIIFGENAGIKSIGTEAFTNTAITTLTIPESVTSFGNYVVGGCQNLEKIVFTSEQPPILVRYAMGVTYFFSDGDMDGKIVVPDAYRQAYIDAWKYYVIGYSPEDAEDLTKDQILEGENMVRAYLGMDPVADQDTTESSGQSGEPGTEDADAITQDSTTETAEDNTPVTESVPSTESTVTTETITETSEVPSEVESTKEEKATVDTTETESSTQEEDTEEEP